MKLLVAIAALTLCAGGVLGQRREIEVETVHAGGNVHMLIGQGGNVGVSIGDDGVFMIDDQFARMTPFLLAAIAELTEEPVRFLVNTHWHGDHTGGNENIGSTGAVIVAHENVHRRMSSEQFMEAFNQTVAPSPDAALPIITFTDSMTFHWNEDEIEIVHVDPAHTDGDSIIFFREARVVHMGDTYFNGMYPFIDTGRDGNIGGMIDAANMVLSREAEIDAVIPGHGALSNIDELRAYRDMLVTVRDRVARLVSERMSRDEVISARPTQDFDENWGGGFMQPDPWVGIVYDGMLSEAGTGG